MAFNKQPLMMGIGVVTLKSESIPSSKKMLLELAFNYNSGTPSSKGEKKPGCAICRPHSRVVCIFKNHIGIGYS